MSNKAIIYTTSTCAYCSVVKNYLKLKGVDLEEKDAEDPQVREEAYNLSGAMTVPITIINDKVIVGWNAKQLAEALND